MVVDTKVGGKNLLVYLDLPMTGEPVHAPQNRATKLPEHYAKTCASFQTARHGPNGPGMGLQRNEVFVSMDGGKALQGLLLKPWMPKSCEPVAPLTRVKAADVVVPPPGLDGDAIDASSDAGSGSDSCKKQKILCVMKPASVSGHKSERSMRRRKKKVQGPRSFCTQVQRRHILVKDWADVPFRNGECYEGSNRGASEGGAPVPRASAVTLSNPINFSIFHQIDCFF